jgi:hypothetical protein
MPGHDGHMIHSEKVPRAEVGVKVGVGNAPQLGAVLFVGDDTLFMRNVFLMSNVPLFGTMFLVRNMALLGAMLSLRLMPRFFVPFLVVLCGGKNRCSEQK